MNATPQAAALARAIAEIERQLLPFVQAGSFGTVTLDVEIERGRVLRIVKTTKQSLKINTEPA